MVEYKDYRWELDRLYLGKKDTSVRLVRDKEHEHMYWIEWNFGKPEKSVNFYNLVNAKDNARVLHLRYSNNIGERASEKPAGAFK